MKKKSYLITGLILLAVMLFGGGYYVSANGGSGFLKGFFFFQSAVIEDPQPSNLPRIGEDTNIYNPGIGVRSDTLYLSNIVTKVSQVKSNGVDQKIFCFDLGARTGTIRVSEIHLAAGSSNTTNLASEYSTWSLEDSNGKILDQVSKFDQSNKLRFEDLEDKIILKDGESKNYCVEVGNSYSGAKGALELSIEAVVAMDSDDRAVQVKMPLIPKTAVIPVK